MVAEAAVAAEETKDSPTKTLETTIRDSELNRALEMEIAAAEEVGTAKVEAAAVEGVAMGSNIAAETFFSFSVQYY